MDKFKKLLAYFLLAGLIFGTVACGDDDDDDTPTPPPGPTASEQRATAFANSFAANGNEVKDPSLGSLYESAENAGATSNGGGNWHAGWSFLGKALADGWDGTGAATTGVDENNAYTDTMEISGDITTDTTWGKTTLWKLRGPVVVNDGVTLTIEAGTVIKGLTGTDSSDVGSLVIARGGMLMAEGTATEPIIMTGDADPLDGTSPSTTSELWGGLIILGKASQNTVPSTQAIEGLDPADPRFQYGGTDDADNSGIFKYISVRHGGIEIGAGNEINGISLGCVGTGTTFDYIEVVGNQDDGIEWYGGTVNGSHLIVLHTGDDAFDYDQGYRGTNEYGFIIYEGSTDGDRGGEHDGGTDPETGTPFATPTFKYITSVGNGSTRSITFRDNAGGTYENSIFYNHGRGIDIEYLSGEAQDSYKQFEDGNLTLSNNIFFGIAAGNTAGEIFTVSEN